MSATAATAKKQKPLKRHPSKLKQASAYTILTLILISIVAVTFAFPLYWIITGSFKTGAAINSTTRASTFTFSSPNIISLPMAVNSFLRNPIPIPVPSAGEKVPLTTSPTIRPSGPRSRYP